MGGGPRPPKIVPRTFITFKVSANSDDHCFFIPIYNSLFLSQLLGQGVDQERLSAYYFYLRCPECLCHSTQLEKILGNYLTSHVNRASCTVVLENSYQPRLYCLCAFTRDTCSDEYTYCIILEFAFYTAFIQQPFTVCSERPRALPND